MLVAIEPAAGGHLADAVHDGHRKLAGIARPGHVPTVLELAPVDIEADPTMDPGGGFVDSTARQAPSFSAGKDSEGWGGGACPRRGQTHLSMT